MASSAETGIEVQLPEIEQCLTLPSALECWFHAPKGDYPIRGVSEPVHNPDYLITWDVYQTQSGVGEGTHQWWEWYPRTAPPQVG